MPSKKFGNQSPKQIIAHLKNILQDDCKYTLIVDPLESFFEIKRTTGRRAKRRGHSEKRERIKSEQSTMRPRKRKLSNSAKRTYPKIRSIKKGRTVSLKGYTGRDFRKS